MSYEPKAFFPFLPPFSARQNTHRLSGFNLSSAVALKLHEIHSTFALSPSPWQRLFIFEVFFFL
jgi:hypothetical protein